MAASRSSPKPTGKHEWNSYDNYCELHERYLSTHQVIERHNVEIGLYEVATGREEVVVYGEIRCRNGVILEVEKYAEIEWRGQSNPRLFVRTYSFRYNASLPGKCTVLRYDNGHGVDEYHAHPYDPKAGREVEVGTKIDRDEMPHLSEVLDEIEGLPI